MSGSVAGAAHSVQDALLQSLVDLGHTDYRQHMIDSFTVCDLVSAVGEKRGACAQAFGRSRAGFTSKVHANCDNPGLSVCFIPAGGEASDHNADDDLMNWPLPAPKGLLANNGYDGDDPPWLNLKASIYGFQKFALIGFTYLFNQILLRQSQYYQSYSQDFPKNILLKLIKYIISIKYSINRFQMCNGNTHMHYNANGSDFQDQPKPVNQLSYRERLVVTEAADASFRCRFSGMRPFLCKGSCKSSGTSLSYCLISAGLSGTRLRAQAMRTAIATANARDA